MSGAMDNRRARVDFVSRFATVVEERLHEENPTIDQQLRGLVRTGAIRYWLLNFLDIVVARWELCEQMTESERLAIVMNESTSRLANPLMRMTDLLAASQSTVWTNSFCKSVLQYWEENGHVSLAVSVADDHPTPTQPMWEAIPQTSGRMFISRTYLGRIPELVLSLMCGTLPSRWREPSFNESIDWRFRETISLNQTGFAPGTIEHFVFAILPYHLPQSLVENLEEVIEWARHRTRKTPSVIFTANLHVGSDSFLIWASQQRKHGARLLLSQHGGLNGQGVLPTRGEEFEQAFADRYLHWGWSNQPEALKIPAQLTIWKKRRRSSECKKSLLLITDCTFRYSRRPWASISDDQEYRKMLIGAYNVIPEGIRNVTTVRLHHDHDNYDESHEKMWRAHHPDVQLDSGLEPIEPLRRAARLVVCTTLGTSEIMQFSQSIPTVLRLHPEIHAVRHSCQALFKSMNDVGVVHYSDESFRSFLKQNWDDIDRWWKSMEVQAAVGTYLFRFGSQSERPLRHLREVLLSVTQ